MSRLLSPFAISSLFVRFSIFLALSLGGMTFQASAEASKVALSAGGKALQSIVVAPNASEPSREAAQSLAEMLSHISGAEFSVKEGDGSTGIAVGSITEFPTLVDASDFDIKDPMRREEYRMRSHNSGLYLIGATPLAARHAVWDLLYRLGYRQFFPGKTWEVIPENPDLAIEVDEKQAPDFKMRRIWYNYGTFRNGAVKDDWDVKNRAGTKGFNLSTGHSYAGYIKNKENSEIFKEHPDYLALLSNGKRVDPSQSFAKFCISKPEVRELVAKTAVRHVRAYIEKNGVVPDSISIDPSDGAGWCTCDDCAKLGSISDQQVILANAVAEAVTKEFPGIKVGMYAYNFHSMPPTIPVNPAIIVSVATSLTRGTMGFKELMQGWEKQGATMGVREYYSIWTWNRSLPGGAKSSGPSSLAKIIKNEYDLGARFLTAESGDDWGSSGLGYYVAARTLWDTKESEKVDAIKEDFLTKAFGPAKEAMREFYALIDRDNHVRRSEDQVAKMYRLLDEASKQTADETIQQRLNELTLFVRYYELYRKYLFAVATKQSDEQRQAAYEETLSHALRIKSIGMVASLPVLRDWPIRDKAIKLPPELEQKTRGTSALFNQEPYTDEEIAAIRKEGIATNNLSGVEEVDFSTELVPATQLHANSESGIDSEAGKLSFHPRYQKTFYTWVPEGQKEVIIQSNAPRIYTLYSVGDTDEEVDELDRRSEYVSKDQDPEMREIRLKTPYSGLHRLVIEGGWGPSQVTWKENTPMAFVPRDIQLWGTYELFFYVPKGTKAIGGYVGQPVSGKILDPDGTVMIDFGKEVGAAGEHFKVDVPTGMDGKFWRVANSRSFSLMTVPNLVALSPRELMLPVEVVNEDQIK